MGTHRAAKAKEYKTVINKTGAKLISFD